MSYSEQNSAIDTFVTCWEESARLKGWETGNVKALSYLVDGNANGFTRTNDIREIVKGIDRVQLLKETYGRMLSVTADRARRNVKLTSNKFLNLLINFMEYNPDYDINKIDRLIQLMDEIIKRVNNCVDKSDSEILYQLLANPLDITDRQLFAVNQSDGQKIAETAEKYREAVLNLSLMDGNTPPSR